MDLVAQLLVGVVTFASTNIDDLFVLALLYADAELRPRSIVAGQLAGIGALVAASAIAGLAAVAIPARATALLGALPLALGVREILARRRSNVADAGPDGDARTTRAGARSSQLLAVAAVTIANGGDNLAVYIPLFVSAPAAIPIHATTFGVLTLVWCWIGSRLVNHGRLAEPLRRHGHAALPFVLAGLGVYILSGVLIG
jgi:cadmium resistance protein CadD (predicted permease)